MIIEVSDTGIGIPEEDLANIFERFYRSDASRSKETGGFGLGLPIAKSILDAAGGSLSIESSPWRGIDLHSHPAAHPQAGAPPRLSRPTPPPVRPLRARLKPSLPCADMTHR